ncbi:S8 family serine peptidase [Roseibium algae]|uniref:S8 family serine peptidase n=1 Tax=Roseibium algae TaxID=3123038 RepID=A0ABU8TE75_9HYPH
MRTIFFLVLALIGNAALQATLHAQTLTQTPQFRLVPADTISPVTHLILTVPLADPVSLPAVAAAIETRFGVTLTAEWPLRSIAVHCFVMQADDNTDLDDIIARMRADAQIRTVQRVRNFETFENLYSDPLFPAQGALTLINASLAQRYSEGAGVKVGVVDSAIDSTHPDLAGRISSLHDFVGDNRGKSGEAHGTAIGGIIAADASNSIGMVGVAPKAELVELRACWQAQGDPGRCNSFSLARALNFAILKKIKLINMSLGGPPDPLLEELVRAAIDDGLIIIAAWGEDQTATFPASVPGVIAAGRFGKDHSIPAPATDVISTAPQNDYRYVSGSSVASAHVAGVVSLLLAIRPDLRSDAIASALRAAVTVRDEKPMLDACQALREVAETSVTCLQ